MPVIPIPDQDEINSYEIEECGVRNLDSPTMQFDVDQSIFTREYLCKWTERFKVFRWFLGWSRTYEDGGTLKLSRLMPQVDADRPDSFIASKITDARGHKWTGFKVLDEDHPETYTFAPGQQANIFEKCRFKVQFEPRVFSLEADADTTSELQRYVSLDSPEPSFELMNFPGASFKYQKDGGGGPSGRAIPMNVGRVMPLEIRKMCWHRLPESAWVPGSPLFDRVYGSDTVTHMAGSINDSAFQGYPAGTLLFSNVRPVRRKSPTGEGIEWDITYEFTFKPSGWNNVYFFGPGAIDSGFYYVSADGMYHAPGTQPDDVSIYNERTFGDLFKVGD